MNICAHIINDSPVKLWGLTSRQRLRRVLDNAGVTDIVDDIAAVPESRMVLLRCLKIVPLSMIRRTT